jgi:hypothetical protein
MHAHCSIIVSVASSVEFRLRGIISRMGWSTTELSQEIHIGGMKMNRAWGWAQGIYSSRVLPARDAIAEGSEVMFIFFLEPGRGERLSAS